MSIDRAQLEELRKSLRADGYSMDVTEAQDRVQVSITAGPDACEECLVPKELMATMLAPALGVDPDRVELFYPADAQAQ